MNEILHVIDRLSGLSGRLRETAELVRREA